jgi:hypothetical protein
MFLIVMLGVIMLLSVMFLIVMLGVIMLLSVMFFTVMLSVIMLLGVIFYCHDEGRCAVLESGKTFMVEASDVSTGLILQEILLTSSNFEEKKCWPAGRAQLIEHLRSKSFYPFFMMFSLFVYL